MIRMKKSAKVWLRVLSLVFALMLLCSNTVFAADMDDVPYYSYCYWEGPSRYTAVPMRAMFEATEQITSDSLGIFDMWVDAGEGIPNEFGIGSSDAEKDLALQHLTLSPDQTELYMLDSGNSRILVVDTETLQLKKVIGQIPLTGEKYGVAAYQDIQLEANTDYVLTWYTSRYGEGTNAYSVNVVNGDTVVATYSFDHAYDFNKQWENHELTFNTGDATDLRLQFQSESNTLGEFFVESMLLVKAGDTEEKNLLVNGNFDDDDNLTGWTLSQGATPGEMVLDETRRSLHLSNSLSYAKSEGVYVTEDGRIIIADTRNCRVLIIRDDAENGIQLEYVIERPQGVEIPPDLEFFPKRVTMDKKGYLYVVDQVGYYGMMVYDTEYNFKGFHGAYKASADLLENLKGWITGLFMTNEKAAASQKDYATAIIDVAMDSQGMIYTLSDPQSNTGQIKRLSLTGTQTLNFKSGFTTQSGDLLNFVEQPKHYYEKGSSFGISCNLMALAVDPQGFIYAADTNRNRIYVYDEECRMLCGFSLGYDQGDQVGTFKTICGLAVSDNKLYVADSLDNQITVFELTEYGAMVKEADTLTINGQYEEAKPLWEQILKLDANNQRAYEGLAKAHLAEKNYDEAMYYAELGNDQATYSQAFSEVQKVWLSHNFWWIFIVCLVAVGAIAAVLVISKKRKIFHIKNDNLRTALSVPFHPFQAFQAMKVQKFTSVGLALIFVAIFYLLRVSQDLYGGFMYVIVDKANYNAVMTLIGSVGLLLLWVITNWGICMLNDGKGSLKEIFCMSAYSMMPLMVYSVIFTVGSHIIPATSTNTFGMIHTILLIYGALLLLIGMTVIHEYSFFKAIGMAIITVLCMALAVFVLCSVVLLAQQFIVFLVSIVNEIRLR